MIEDGLLIFKPHQEVGAVLPLILAGSGIGIKPGSVRYLATVLEAETTPTIPSWWGERIQIEALPVKGGTCAFAVRSAHQGPSFGKDLSNVARLRSAARNVMQTFGVTVSWVRPQKLPFRIT